MTHRKFFLASLILLPLGFSMVGAAIAGNPQSADLQVAFKVAENRHDNGKDAETPDGAQEEGTVESNDGAQNEGNVEFENGGHLPPFNFLKV